MQRHVTDALACYYQYKTARFCSAACRLIERDMPFRITNSPLTHSLAFHPTGLGSATPTCHRRRVKRPPGLVALRHSLPKTVKGAPQPAGLAWRPV
jgi:hypothetical protein